MNRTAIVGAPYILGLKVGVLRRKRQDRIRLIEVKSKQAGAAGLIDNIDRQIRAGEAGGPTLATVGRAVVRNAGTTSPCATIAIGMAFWSLAAAALTCYRALAG
jgi:hypothetical protein